MDYNGKYFLDELKCVWTSTNLIGDKLCNHNYECEGCDFDKEMRDKRHQKELCESVYFFPEHNILENIIHKLSILKNFVYPQQYIFYNCFVLKKFLGEVYFIGFNPIIYILLDNIFELSILGTSQIYKKGDRFILFKGDWGSVEIAAPFNFNFEFETIPISFNSESGKWFGLIKSENGDLNSLKNGKDEFFKMIDFTRNSLKKYIKKYVTIGITMYNGGERVKYIYQIVGKENYINILKQILL